MADRDVLWTDTARQDLEQIVAYIAEESPAERPEGDGTNRGAVR